MVEVKVDRLNLKVESVPVVVFNKIKSWAEFAEGVFIDFQKYTIGTQISGYHHNLNIGKGEGGIYIGYKHNLCKGADNFDMKIDCNPQKVLDNDKQRYAWETIIFMLNDYKKFIRSIDLAMDFPVSISSIFVVPMTGKMESRVGSTKYFGSRDGNNRLKVYDKKAERKKAGVEVPFDNLTRVEFTAKWDNPLNIDSFWKCQVSVDKYYRIRLPKDMNSIEGEIRAFILAIQSGDMQLKDFKRRTKEKIKKSLEQLEDLAVDQLIRDGWDNIYNFLNEFVKYKNNTNVAW